MFNPDNSEKLKELLVGLCAGSLATGIGMPGVPLIFYFGAKNTPKAVARSTALAFFIAVYVTSLTTQMLTAKIGFNVITFFLLLAPVSFIGVFLGDLMFHRINQRMFQTIANIMLLFTGLYMLLKAI